MLPTKSVHDESQTEGKSSCGKNSVLEIDPFILIRKRLSRVSKIKNSHFAPGFRAKLESSSTFKIHLVIF